MWKEDPVTDAPPQIFRARTHPTTEKSGNGSDFFGGVKKKGDAPADIPTRDFGGKAFAVWYPAESYAQAIKMPRSFIVDRTSGLIVFPLGAEGADPSASGGGREIRVWYCRGGGRAGNVAPSTLTVL